MILEAICLWFGVACTELERPPRTGITPPTVAVASIGSVPRAVPPGRVKPIVEKPIGFPPACPIIPPDSLTPHFVAAARRYPGGATACELAKQSWCESGFRLDAVSPAGAIGVSQFMPATAAELDVDPWDPRASIYAQARYVDWAQRRWTPGLGGRTDFDLRGLRSATYNWGLGNMRRDQSRHGWVLYRDGEPGFPEETRDYFWCIERGTREDVP